MDRASDPSLQWRVHHRFFIYSEFSRNVGGPTRVYRANTMIDQTTELVHFPRASLARRAKITLGIAALGAIGGAAAGGMSAVVVAAIIDGTMRSIFSASLFAVGAEIGAPLGTLLLPLAAWTLLRRVSFGRAILGTVPGTLAGGLAGWFITMDTSAIFRSIAGGVIGFVAAAVLMRVRARSVPEP